MVMAQARRALNQPVDIAELYESACWSNAPVRAKIQAAATHKQQQEQRQADQQRTDRARAASGSLPGTGGATTDQPLTLEEELRKNMKLMAT